MNSRVFLSIAVICGAMSQMNSVPIQNDLDRETESFFLRDILPVQKDAHEEPESFLQMNSIQIPNHGRKETVSLPQPEASAVQDKDSEETESDLQVISSPNRAENPKKIKSYVELKRLKLKLLFLNGTELVLSPKEVLALKSQLLANAEKIVLYKLTDEEGFSHLLSDHQIERLLDFQVIAVVSRDERDILKGSGFGHLMIILEKDGIIKSFAFKMTLLEAIRELPQNMPFNFSTSPNAYHIAFQDKMKVPAGINFTIRH